MIYCLSDLARDTLVNYFTIQWATPIHPLHQGLNLSPGGGGIVGNSSKYFVFAFGIKSKKKNHCQDWCQGSYPCFLLVLLFWILHSSLKSIWADLCVWCKVERGPISFFCMWISSFPRTIYWRDCPFSILYSWLLFHRLIDHRGVGLFLDLYTVSLICVSVFSPPIPYGFDYYSFVI